MRLSKEKLRELKKTVKHDLSVTARACRMVEQFAPRYILHCLLFGFFEETSHFYMVFFSGEMLNEIVGGRDVKRLILFAVLAVCGEQLLYISSKYSWRRMRVGMVVCEQWEEMVLNDKSFRMDFKNTEDPAVRTLRQSIVDNRSVGGLANLHSISSLFCCLLSVVYSVVLLGLTFFTHADAPQSAVLRMIDSDRTFLLFLAVAVFCAVRSGILGNRFQNMLFGFNQRLPVVGRLMDFFTQDYLDDSKAYKDLHIFAQRELIRDSFEKTLAKWLDLDRRRVAGMWTMQFRADALSILTEALVYALVAVKVMIGSLGVGDFLKCATAGNDLLNSLGATGSIATGLHNNVKYLDKLFEYLDLPTEMYYGTIPTEKRSDGKYDIEFHDVSFRYPGSDVYALRHLSFKMKVGERVAVVGMNGSGKTTMIKLLCRLYDPTEGYITLNGIDVKKYDYGDLLALFSVVFQDFRLFSFSLGENVSSNVEYDEERVAQCLKKSGMGETLARLPEGTKTAIYKDFDENGVEISGGEAQKIALARALYKDAPFVVLDEPTAALDPIAEADIYARFNEIVGDRTVIYISHRLSSCRFCDRIAVFHEGELVQTGTHDELLADEGGKYRELWTAQAQYYTISNAQ
ncbi:MAG: ABC transporter ATP-binding protein [Clostridia bacterium]|nr:ABC transporter ATP-binding protein [Clostridia bacterium]